MIALTTEQRNIVYLEAAERTGIHTPILAALYQVQGQPALPDGETGLGIAPANRVTLDQVNRWTQQVHYAANTIRSLTNHLIAEGWKGADLWDVEQGHYQERLIQAIATGFTAPTSDLTAALLEASNPATLWQAYLDAVKIHTEEARSPQNLVSLEQALLTFVQQLPRHFIGLPHQREALLQAFQLWHQLDSRDAAIATLQSQSLAKVELTQKESIDLLLLQFIQPLARSYAGYPHQREAILRLIQLWRQLDSRQAAIASLAMDTSSAPSLTLVDSALIALVQHIPALYRGKGEQRNALIEGFRLWHDLEHRSEVLVVLGIDPAMFAKPAPDQFALIDAATQTDQRLLDFIRSIPGRYKALEQQREALLRMTQLWRNLETRGQTLQSLWEDLKRMQSAGRDDPDAPTAPSPIIPPERPVHWTPETIQIHATILPNGSFTWAEATQGGTWMPSHQTTVDAIVRIATLVQQVRDRLSRPFHITRWYCPEGNTRHLLGDAIEFYCNGLTGDQLYWFLDPWWTGGLGHSNTVPYLCYVDARSYRARWLPQAKIAIG